MLTFLIAVDAIPFLSVRFRTGVVFSTAADQIFSALGQNDLDRISFVRFEVPHIFRAYAHLSGRFRFIADPFYRC